MPAVFVAALVAIAPAHAPAAHPRRLTDAALVRYAASRFDARKMMFRHEVVGLHRGTLVVADFPCGDVCPQYTRRIIHYQVDMSRCSAVGGIVVDELIPLGIAVRRKPYCEPAVLAKLHRSP
jgi:hypothetical protein